MDARPRTCRPAPESCRSRPIAGILIPAGHSWASPEQSIASTAASHDRCRTRLGKLAALSCLAPDIVTAIVAGRQSASLTARALQDIDLPLAWTEYDACSLIAQGNTLPPLLVDQGDADVFLSEQLKTHLLEEVCADRRLDAVIRMQPDYDRSYYFISTFMDEHLRWHAERLLA